MSFTNATGTGISWDSTNGTAIQVSLAGDRIGLFQFHPTVGTSVNGQGNTFLGYKAGVSNYQSVSLGYNNTFIGGQAGQANDSGYQNTFMGSSSGAKNTTGKQNTFLGQGAGYENIAGNSGTHIGYHAGLNIIGSVAGLTENTIIGALAGEGAIGSIANANVFIGNSVALLVTSAKENVIVGRQAANALTSGNQNSLLGSAAGISLTTGSDNIFIGRRSGYTQSEGNATTTGSQNIFIGTEAGASISTQLTNAIAIGYRATVNSSNTMVLGNSSITMTLLNGTVGIGTTSPNAKLEINGGVRLNTATAKPTCDSTQRGTFWVSQGAAGVKDNVEVCAKDAGDAYSWRTLY